MSGSKEIQRIKEVYAKRSKNPRFNQIYSLFNPGNLFIVQERERVLLEMLAEAGVRDLSELRVLDVGCGAGSELMRLVIYGASPENLYGIDILEDHISAAWRKHPKINWGVANAEAIPFPAESFDIVMQFTVFSSILDEGMKSRIAAEMLRVLRKDGLIIWYDYWINPVNRDAKGVTGREIKKLFPGCRIKIRRVTLAPPLVRILAPLSLELCQLVSFFCFFRTHYLCLIKKGS